MRALNRDLFELPRRAAAAYAPQGARLTLDRKPVARRHDPRFAQCLRHHRVAIIAPGRVPGNTSAPRFPPRASASTSSACRNSGTR